MSHYHVTPGPKKTFARPHALFAIGALVLALVGLPAFTTMSVTVDGDQYRIERGATAREVIALGLTAEQPGDLVTMSGQTLATGRGTPPALLRRGVELDPDARVHQSDVLVSESGRDVVERQVATSTVVPIEIEYRGEGPIEAVASDGEEGIALRGVGTVSGVVTPFGVQRPSKPMVVERSYPVAGDKVVALTFDDGPWPGQTEKVLEILEAEGVPATFFVLGAMAKSYPELTARIAEEGHQIGSHGYSHRYLTSDNQKVAEREIKRAKFTISHIIGEYPTVFRAPGGVLSETARDEAGKAGQRVVRWDVDPQDWRQDRASKIARNTIAEVRPGSVILLHDGGGDRTNTIKALKWIIHELEAQGYTFVTLDELGTASRL